MAATTQTNQTMELFTKLTQGLVGVQADRGEGISDGWPKSGTYTVKVVSMMIKTEGETYKSKGWETAGVRIQFKYQIEGDPEGNEAGRMFYGESFRLPLDATSVTDPNTLKNIEITRRRLAGFIECILGRTASGSPQDLFLMQETVTKSTVIMTIKVVNKPARNPEYRDTNEYAVELLNK